MTRALALAAALTAATAQAVPFSVTISNTAPSGTPAWSTGLLTLSPVIAVGPSPQPGNPDYFTYAFANSNCKINDSFCGTTCNDNGNATVLAQRRGLTIGTNAWTVPALAVGASTTVTIDVPVGSRLSYVAWVNSTAVFDDLIAMHQPGSPSVLSAPLFDASGNPLSNVAWELRGYDVNSVSPTDGSGGTCTNECPATGTGACYVAVGNASYGATGALGPQLPGPISKLTALSGNGSNRLTWTNPAPSYGVVVLRRINQAVASTPSGNPTVGTTYGNGNASNRSVVVYNGTGTNTVLDTYSTGTHPLTNGSRYYYKVFAKNSANQYASGDVPSSSGLFSIPTLGTLPNPRWCYSFGMAAAMQPVLTLGSGVYLGSNTGGITANNPDGSERFRPVQLPGVLQGRFLALPLQGRSGTWLIATDQSGNVTVLDGATGNRAWTRNVATNIQAQPSAQLYVASNAAFQAAHPGRDLILVASRNSSTTSNTVTALSSVDGSTVWQYAPGNLDIISGGMLLDRTNNRLWVASRASGGANNPSIRVLSTLNGALLRSYQVGDIDLPVSWGYTVGEAIVTRTNGEVRAYNLSTMDFSWSHSPGTQTAYAFPTGDGYIGSFSAGNVQRYSVNQTTKAVTALWSPAAAIANPTGVRVDYNSQKAIVGNAAGVMSQLNLTTGAIEQAVTVQAAVALGTPNVDTNLNRLYVPVTDGRLCAYDVPF